MVLEVNRAYRAVKVDPHFQHLKPLVAAKFVRRTMVRAIEEYPESRISALWERLLDWICWRVLG